MNRLVIAAGMRRGGSTLQYQLIADVLAANGIECTAGWVDLVDANCLAPAADGPTRLVKTHRIPKIDPGQIVESGAIVFYISRDPRDSLVSYLRKYSVDCTDSKAARYLSRVEAEFRFWTSLPSAHCMVYEDLVREAPRGILAIAAALGLPLSTAQSEAIAAARSIEQQKQRLQQLDWSQQGMSIDQDLVDRQSLLHSNHIYNGEIGGWRSLLSRKQVAIVESGFGTFIRDAGYPLQSGRLEQWLFHNGDRVVRMARSIAGQGNT